MGDPNEAKKRIAIRRAVEEVRSGMIVGLGSGSTAELVVPELAGRLGSGFSIVCVSTSIRTAGLACAAGLSLRELDEVDHIDVTLDGADEIDLASFACVKGRGGALLREKLVAAATRREMIVADDSKIVRKLGDRMPVPVEIVRFGGKQTAARLQALGARPVLRLNADLSGPFLTDESHFILDCHFGPIGDPRALGASIKAIVGVVEHGLFLEEVRAVIVGGDEGAVVYHRPEKDRG